MPSVDKTAVENSHEKGDCPCCSGSGILTQSHHTVKENLENKPSGGEVKKMASKVAKNFMKRDEE